MWLVSLLMLGCTPELPDEAVFFAPDSDGPHRAGTVQTTTQGQTGVTLPLQIWYPTDDTSGNIAGYDGFEVGQSLYAAQPACDTPRPVVVFSHGNSAFRFQSVFLMERLASHGFVVVAPDHVGNTAFDMSLPREAAALRRPLDVTDAFDHLVIDETVAANAPLPFRSCLTRFLFFFPKSTNTVFGSLSDPSVAITCSIVPRVNPDAEHGP